MHLRSAAVVLVFSSLVACSAASTGGNEAPVGGTASASGAPALEVERCNNGKDDDGDGLVDEACACSPGATQSCFTGPADRRNRGACRDGTQTCQSFGEFFAWGTCVGEVLPSAEIPGNGVDEDCSGSEQCEPAASSEICDNQIDDDCDGQLDCADPDCAALCNCAASETCDNGADDDCDGQVDCSDVDCAASLICTSATCSPAASSEASCDDGKDDDCDGSTDCADTDCRKPGSCGCSPVETACADGQDEDCDGLPDCGDLDCQKCVPGAQRFCDEPSYCGWGLQTCMPDGTWGACGEVPPPPGCEPPFPFMPASYDLDCCLQMGFCCQSYPQNDSVGNCAGVDLC